MTRIPNSRLAAEVFPLEGEEIRTRRARAQLTTSSSPTSESAAGDRGAASGSPAKETEPRSATLPPDLIGVALSGGGIRSAAFGLGVLQSLYSKGVLRFADYLSTVSGGSYVGSFLASMSLDPIGKLKWTPKVSDAAKADKSPANDDAVPDREWNDVAPDEFGRQPEAVQRLIYGGNYLKHPVQLLTHWLPGFLGVNLVGFSGLVCVCAIVAFLFRCLDYPWMMRLTSCLGFQDDIMRAFFPTFLVFVVWGLYSIGRASRALMGKRGEPGKSGQSSFAKSLTMALVMITLLSAVSLLGVANVDTSVLETRLKLHLDPEYKEWLSRMLSTALYSFVVIGLLPYLNPRALLRSGTDPRRPRDRYIFQITTYALAWGMPLIVFAFLAREDLSYYNSWRPDRNLLTKPSIKGGAKFWASLSDASPPTSSAPSTSVASSTPVASSEPSWPLVLSTSPMPSPNTESTKSDASKESARDYWREPTNQIWKELEKYKPSFGPLAKEQLSVASIIEDLSISQRQMKHYDANTSLAYHLWDALRMFSPYSDFQDEWAQRIEIDARSELLVAIANYQLLSSPNFYSNFEPIYEKFRESDPKKLADQKRMDEPRLVELRRRYEEGFASYQRLEAKSKKDYPEGSRRADEERTDTPVSALKKWADFSLKAAEIKYALTFHSRREEDGDEWRSNIAKFKSDADALKKKYPDAFAELSALHTINYSLWKTYFGPDQVTEESVVFASIVHGADQDARFWIACGSFALFIVFGLLLNLNSTTLHGFYLDRLASQWLVQVSDRKTTELRLDEIATCERGAPYLLVNAALTMMSNRVAGIGDETEGFLLSRRLCGSERFGYTKTTQFGERPLSLADAMAISGAAVTPSVTTNFAVRALMWMGNFRLGQWLPNPRLLSQGSPPSLFRPLWRRPTPLYLLASRLLVDDLDREFHFVGDGGLHENLGIEALFMRRCKLIIAVDAAVDPKYQFADLVKLAFRARVHHGITLTGIDKSAPWGLSSLEPLGGSNSDASSSDDSGGAGPDRASDPPSASAFPKSHRHFLVLKVNYPDRSQDDPAYLIYIRPSFSGDEPDELRTYCKQNHEFPQDSTVDQFFEPRRFEAYRYLGNHIGDDLCKKVFDELAADERDGAKLIELAGQFVDDLAKARQMRDFGPNSPSPAETKSKTNSPTPTPETRPDSGTL